jgi:hypothetical protein
MFTNKIYTGIGSRETPEEVLMVMIRIGSVLAHNGWTLRSGHCSGPDQYFEYGADKYNGKMQIYLPWDKFEGARHDGVRYFAWWPDSNKYSKAVKIAEHFHPKWSACSSGAQKMHTRNVAQVLGMNLDLPSDFIICWTKDGKQGDGTGQALRIAQGLRNPIPIFDLAIHTEEQVLNFINYGVLP